MEWLDPVNPFNSLKCLAWADRLQRFYAGRPDGPVTVDIEPTNACNLKCPWCFPEQWRKTHPGGMSAADLVALPAALELLGVTTVTLTGGGEPLLHPGVEELMRDLLSHEIRYSLITNGTRLGRVDQGLLRSADWIGISVDAGTAETWAAVKGGAPADFDTICSNIKSLAQHVPVTFKFLAHESNHHELVDAIRLAEGLGCAAFQARPAWGASPTIGLQASIEAARFGEFSGRKWRRMAVHIVTHKIDEGGRALKPFRRCQATPLLITVCADGQCYLCQDHRGEEAFRLCNIHDLAEFWGTSHHREMLSKIDPCACGKCTFSGYNEALGKLMPEYL